MPKYLVQACYTAEAIASFVKSPQDRSTGLRVLLEKLGGRLDSIHYCFGDYDVIVMCEFPDDTAAAAAVLAASAAGHLKSIKTTKLMTEADFIASQKKAQSVTYKPPQ